MMSCMSCHTVPGFEEISFKILIVISPFFNWPLASSVSNSLSPMIKMYMYYYVYYLFICIQEGQSGMALLFFISIFLHISFEINNP